MAAVRKAAPGQGTGPGPGLVTIVEAREESPLPLPCLIRARVRLEGRLRELPAEEAPARLDRHGLELWAATPEGWERTRLPFELPLASPDQLPGTLQLLLSRAQTCCRERLALRPADD